jgi:hypothetical protein
MRRLESQLARMTITENLQMGDLFGGVIFLMTVAISIEPNLCKLAESNSIGSDTQVLDPLNCIQKILLFHQT